MVQTHGDLPFLTGFTIPLSVLHMSVCFSLLSPSWLPDLPIALSKSRQMRTDLAQITNISAKWGCGGL